jgi:threonylcarbamoyladenosine tRNA methylthiotransferase CDKAL1
LIRKACVLCTGCPESRIDSARVQNFLRENGWNTTDELEEADLILFRTCGLTDESAEKSLQVVRRIKNEKRGDAQLVVWGCLPKVDLKALRTEYGGVTFGDDEIAMLNDIVKAKKPIEKVTASHLLPGELCPGPGLSGLLSRLLSFAEVPFNIDASSSIFHIKVSTGCLGNCSFCAVPKSRGVVHSKSIDSVVSEFRRGLDKGFQYFSLLGTDLGAYGRDQGCNLVDLLAEMTKEKGDYQISLRNVNPFYLNEMFEELKRIFSSGKIRFLSSAVESASDRILKLMRRKYQIQDFKSCIRTLNEKYPNIMLRTQLMVGFPTETKKDFHMSLHLLDELRFDWVEVYQFSARPGTPAAMMEGQVPARTKSTRFRTLTLKAISQHPHRKVSQILRSRLFGMKSSSI